MKKRGGIGKNGNSRQCFDIECLNMPKSKRSTRIFNQKNTNFLPNSKRSQVTVFIILALAILVILILLFVQRQNIFPTTSAQTSPVFEIKKCMADAVKQNAGLIASQGGSLNPSSSYLYEGNKLQYLCYSSEYYQPCVMQKPLLKSDIERELEESSKSQIESCINAIKDSLIKKGYTVNSKKPDVKVELILNNIIVSAENVDLEISKASKESYKSIKTEISSKMYEFAMIASSISNLEAHYGNSETMTYMMYYPSLKVQKIPQGDGTRVYILTNKETNEKFMFAARSMTYPSGVTGS